MSLISVFIIDDSALMRSLISKIVSSDSRFEIAGTASNGVIALEKLKTIKPDIITLDIEMPELNGIGFLKAMNKLGSDIPVIILSSLARSGASITMEALALGAVDFLCKPSGAISIDLNDVAHELIDKIATFGGNKKPLHPYKQELLGRSSSSKNEDWPIFSRPVITKHIEVVCIGISTGGPGALRTVLASIKRNFPWPILIVQHMPPVFTAEFALSLDRICLLDVCEASDNDIVQAGRIYIAPGNKHMIVQPSNQGVVIKLTDENPCNGHRPSADVLFKSISTVYQGEVIALIMTGMGYDGARQIGELYHKGAITIAQNSQTSVVYGMPKVAVEHGYIHHELGVNDIAPFLNNIASQYNISQS